jgi:hypothetical protein
MLEIFQRVILHQRMMLRDIDRASLQQIYDAFLQSHHYLIGQEWGAFSQSHHYLIGQEWDAFSQSHHYLIELE